ncbi:MAG TPA: response regulator transcription factor [Actinomycetota bacterium]|jgi:DNA-binding NarL/FixJ family response regulator
MIVDDHALVRRGMAHVVRECFGEAEIVESGSAEEAISAARADAVDLALVDVRMPDTDGLDLLHSLRTEWPTMPVIMLTTFDHANYVRRALAEGAAGYLLKDATPDDLEQAIKVALSGGGNVLSPRVIQNLFESMDESSDDRDTHRRPASSLTQRETDILGLLSEGRSNRDISRALFLSEKTVKAHLAAIFRKLGVSNRTQAAMAAVAMGIGPGPLAADATVGEPAGGGAR